MNLRIHDKVKLKILINIKIELYSAFKYSINMLTAENNDNNKHSTYYFLIYRSLANISDIYIAIISLNIMSTHSVHICQNKLL